MKLVDTTPSIVKSRTFGDLELGDIFMTMCSVGNVVWMKTATGGATALYRRGGGAPIPMGYGSFAAQTPVIEPTSIIINATWPD